MGARAGVWLRLIMRPTANDNERQRATARDSERQREIARDSDRTGEIGRVREAETEIAGVSDGKSQMVQETRGRAAGYLLELLANCADTDTYIVWRQSIPSITPVHYTQTPLPLRTVSSVDGQRGLTSSQHHHSFFFSTRRSLTQITQCANTLPTFLFRRTTAKVYFKASSFFESMKQFGELDEDVRTVQKEGSRSIQQDIRHCVR